MIHNNVWRMFKEARIRDEDIPILHKIENSSAVTVPVLKVLHQLELPCSCDRTFAYAYSTNIFLSLFSHVACLHNVRSYWQKYVCGRVHYLTIHMFLAFLLACAIIGVTMICVVLWFVSKACLGVKYFSVYPIMSNYFKAVLKYCWSSLWHSG